jgi:uncharacterized protein
MGGTPLVDAGFLIALLSKRDTHHNWAASVARESPPPWSTCEAALSEALHLLGARGASALVALLRRGAVRSTFVLGDDLEPVLKLIHKHADLPMSLADACLVRMTETLDSGVVLTTDTDFRVYRRNGRQVVPCRLPD